MKKRYTEEQIIGFLRQAHAGLDGMALGEPDGLYHFGLTLQRAHAVGRATSQGHLMIFYLPETSLWPAAVSHLRDPGSEPAASDNPSRDNRGATFEVAYVSGTWRCCSERTGSRQPASAPTPARRRVDANAPNPASTTTMQTLRSRSKCYETCG